MNLGDLWQYPFPVDIYGTVAAWVGSLLTGLSFAAAAAYYIYDKHLDSRSQAQSIRVEIPSNSQEEVITVHNFSDAAILNVDAQLIEVSVAEQVVSEMAANIRTNPRRLRKELKRRKPIQGHQYWPVAVGLKSEDGQLAVSAGESKSFKGGVWATSDTMPLYLLFTDARGKGWRLRVSDSKLEPRAGSLTSRVKYRLKPKVIWRSYKEWRVSRITKKVRVHDVV
ncbi:putative uncharacterized protein [Rhodococcus sp. AW25M09]|uniref:hypothetical protein n=1 Tax=Rhodococcus sp. AW25M09 TaxID=1268303 RepID=UPI0002ABEE33|nr:hypothetical protein [Rhodococcus sp. AW25M09]CCQ15877.1 putative uncharacterized protein [Rhodococcus sp. AW25M09]